MQKLSVVTHQWLNIFFAHNSIRSATEHHISSNNSVRNYSRIKPIKNDKKQ